MKPWFLFLLLFIIRFDSKAQSPEICLQSGINYGGAASGIGENVQRNFQTGFTAGLVLDFEMRKKMHFQPSLDYTQKGYRQSINTETVYSRELYKLNYAELIFNFMYHSNDGFFEGIGPVFSVGLSGKYHNEYKNENGELVKEVSDVKFGDSYSQAGVKKAEIGINGIAGKEFENGIFISANTYYGITHSLVNRNNVYFALKLGFKINKQD